jgi:hypothetical protein
LSFDAFYVLYLHAVGGVENCHTPCAAAFHRTSIGNGPLSPYFSASLYGDGFISGAVGNISNMFGG